MFFENNRLTEDVLNDKDKFAEWEKNLLEAYSIDITKDKEMQELSEQFKAQCELDGLNEGYSEGRWWSAPGAGPFDWMKGKNFFAPLKWLIGLASLGLMGILASIWGLLKKGNKEIAVAKLKNFLGRIVALADAGWKKKKNLACLLRIERSARKQVLIQACELLESAGFNVAPTTEKYVHAEQYENPFTKPSMSEAENEPNPEHPFTDGFSVPDVEGVDWSLLSTEKADSGWLNWGILLPFKHRNKGTNALYIIKNTADLEKSAVANTKSGDKNAIANNYVTSLSSVYSKSISEVIGQQASATIARDIKNQLINMSKNTANAAGRPDVAYGGKPAANDETNFFEEKYLKFRNKLFESSPQPQQPVNNNAGQGQQAQTNQQAAQQQNAQAGQQAQPNQQQNAQQAQANHQQQQQKGKKTWANDSNIVWVVTDEGKNRSSLDGYLRMGANFQVLKGLIEHYNAQNDTKVKFDVENIFDAQTKSVRTSYFDRYPDKLRDFFVLVGSLIQNMEFGDDLSKSKRGILQMQPKFSNMVNNRDKNGANQENIASGAARTMHHFDKSKFYSYTNNNDITGYVGFAQREGQVFTSLTKNPQEMVCYKAAHAQMEVFLKQLDIYITNMINRIVPKSIDTTKDQHFAARVTNFFFRSGNDKKNNGLELLWKGNYFPELQRRMNARSGNVISSREMEYYRQTVEVLIPQIIEKATTGKVTDQTSADLNDMQDKSQAAQSQR